MFHRRKVEGGGEETGEGGRERREGASRTLNNLSPNHNIIMPPKRRQYGGVHPPPHPHRPEILALFGAQEADITGLSPLLQISLTSSTCCKLLSYFVTQQLIKTYCLPKHIYIYRMYICLGLCYNTDNPKFNAWIGYVNGRLDNFGVPLKIYINKL